jgi:mono/diheme cytochrome c family protein
MRTFAIAAVLLSACASARRGEPVAGPLQLDDRARQGEIAFMHYCNQCHPGGEAGTGTSINNKPVPHVAMRLQVRQGVLGIMPKFSDAELPDHELDLILDYLDALASRHPSQS